MSGLPRVISDPVRVLFTIPNFITAGSGRAMLNIIERLDRSRFSPAVCVMKKGGKLDREVERLEIPFLEAPFTLPAKPYASLPRRAAEAARPFRDLEPALWHSFHYSDDYTEPLIARRAGARWIFTKKNMNWHRRSWYLRSLFASRIAAQNTDMMRDFFGNPLFRRKARLVPPGVNSEYFRPDAGSGDFRGDLGIPPGAVAVGCVAHLLPVKGIATLLRAAAPVPNLYLLLAGSRLDPEHAAFLDRTVAELSLAPRVRFLGEVSRVKEFLLELDIFVLPTWGRGEGCPVALLEAMACGRASVATDVPGSRDVIVPGKSGVLVPPQNAEALARALQELAAAPELRRALGQEARTRILERHTIEKEVAAYEALYGDLVPVPRGPRR